MKKKKIILIIILLVITLILSGVLIYKNIKNEKEDKIIQSNQRDETKEQVEITNDYINIRKEASSESDVLGKVYKEEIYTVLEKQDDEYYNWVLIETNNNIKGYIAIKYEENTYANYLEVKEIEETEDEE